MYSAMKKTLTISVLAALVLCGCQKEELKIEKTTEQKTFTAEIESNIDDAATTKTSLSPSDQNNQFNVVWSAEDQVSIFAGSTANAQYQVAEAGKTSATLNPVSSESVTGDAVSTNVAYYPYSSSVAISEAEGSYTISGITLPATQTYAEASFASGAFPMAAVTASKDDTNLNFKNILGGLKLQLTGTAKVRSISVSGNNNEILCGSASVTVSSTADPSITLSDAAATAVTLDCGEGGVQLNETTATPFIIALPPMTFSKGFTAMVTDTEGKLTTITTAKSKTITRSQLLKMAAKELNPFTLTSVGSTSVSIVKSGNPTDISLQYRKNSEAWADYTVGTSITLADGEALQFRAGEDENSTFSTDYQNYYCITMTGSGTIKASGNIMSLLDQTLTSSYVPISVFQYLFRGNTKLTEAANLKLPATTLSNYCYSGMFSECSALTTAPALLPATTLSNYCYKYMFYKCLALTTAPELPATTLAKSCYDSMFYLCEILTTAPELPAEKLAYCCYSDMFLNCYKLTYVKALFTTMSSEDDIYRWMNNAGQSTSRGTFVKKKGTDWTKDDLGLSYKWNLTETEE